MGGQQLRHGTPLQKAVNIFHKKTNRIALMDIRFGIVRYLAAA